MSTYRLFELPIEVRSTAPEPKIGDLVIDTDNTVYLCEGTHDSLSGYCTTHKCSFYNDVSGCTAFQKFRCIGIHWYKPIEDLL